MRRNYQCAFVLLCIMLFIAGCSADAKQSSTSDSYEAFKNKFMEFKSKFSPTGFVNISPQELVVRTTSFPEQRIDDKRIDALNDDVQYPLRYEVYYQSNSSSVLAKLNFIYLPSNVTSSFLTINTVNQLENPNIVDQYSYLRRPLFDEYIIAQEGFLVVMNFFDITDDDEEDYDKKYSKFIAETTDFYREFETVLLGLQS